MYDKPLAVFLQSCSDHLNAPSTFKEDDDIDDHYIMVILKVYLVS